MKNITLISRILISALFLLSAVAKLYPTPLYVITKVFEEGQLIPMGFSSDFSPFLSRLIIGFEFFIAFAILQSHYIKKLVIPSTILLLSVFCIDLAIDIFGGVDENCGCFGELIPMTPIQAFIKNIFTILLLFFIYRNVTDKEKSSFLLLFNGFLIISVLMFSLIPIQKLTKSVGNNFISYVNNDSFKNSEERKILCFFDPDCDHCQKAARNIDSLRNLSDNFPEVHVIFSDMDNDSIPGDDMKKRIDNFLKLSGSFFSYQTMPFENFDTDEIDSYLEITYPLYDNPVVIVYDGIKQVRLYEGSGNNEYSGSDLQRILERKK